MSTRKPIQRLPHIVRALAPIKIGKIRIRSFLQDSSTPKRERRGVDYSAFISIARIDALSNPNWQERPLS